MRKRLTYLLAGLVGGVAIGAPSTLAAMNWSRTANGIRCESASGGVACLPTTGEGYGVGIHRQFVFVMNLQTGKRVFTRLQP